MSEAIADMPEFHGLRRRVDRLERELAVLRRRIAPLRSASAVQEGLPEGDVSVSDKGTLRAAALDVLRDLGIPEDPVITPEELQQRMIAGGIDPEECLASRAIVAAREGER